VSDRAALLAAIIAHPDEDTPRLALADWLDEHGEAKRAALIRTQIEHHRALTTDDAIGAVAEFLSRQSEGVGRVNWGAVDPALKARLAVLKASARASSLRERTEGLPRVKGVIFGNNERGFFDEALVEDPAAFLRHAGAIFNAAPIVWVKFEALTAEQAAEFASSGHLARVRRLVLDDGAEPEAIRALGAHPDAAGVRWLEVGFERDETGTVDALEALAAGTFWTGVESLDLQSAMDGESPPEDGQIAALMARPQFCNLRRLVAWNSGADDDTVKSIVKNLPELRTLDLAINPISDGVRVLAGARGLRHLRTLDVSSCDLAGDPSALLVSPNLPNLTVLHLDGNDFGQLNPKALAKGRGPGLRVLHLGNASLPAAGLEALGKCPAVRGLWHLSFDSARLGDEHLERFCRSADIERLVYLGLFNTDITARGAKALAAWPSAIGLQYLDVSDNSIGEAGAKALAASPHLARLKYLHASGRGITTLKKRFGEVLV
jgi:uncharacterized protein (TIGR02996 family)